MAGPFSRQNFQQRAGSKMPGRVRRALDGGVESTQRYGDTLEVAQDGRLEVRMSRNSGLKRTADGLAMVDAEAGDKNRAQLNRIKDVEVFTITAATSNGSVTLLRDNINAAVLPSIQDQLTRLEEKQNELLAELRRTQNMRS